MIQRRGLGSNQVSNARREPSPPHPEGADLSRDFFSADVSATATQRSLSLLWTREWEGAR